MLEVEHLIKSLKAAGKPFEHRIYKDAPGGHEFKMVGIPAPLDYLQRIRNRRESVGASEPLQAVGPVEHGDPMRRLNEPRGGIDSHLVRPRLHAVAATVESWRRHADDPRD